MLACTRRATVRRNVKSVIKVPTPRLRRPALHGFLFEYPDINSARHHSGTTLRFVPSVLRRSPRGLWKRTLRSHALWRSRREVPSRRPGQLSDESFGARPANSIDTIVIEQGHRRCRPLGAPATMVLGDSHVAPTKEPKVTFALVVCLRKVNIEPVYELVGSQIDDGGLTARRSSMWLALERSILLGGATPPLNMLGGLLISERIVSHGYIQPSKDFMVVRRIAHNESRHHFCAVHRSCILEW